MAVAMAACRPVLAPKVPAPRKDPSPAYEQLLVRAVSEDGYVDYDVLEEGREALDDYVAWISRPKRVQRANTQHGFWLDAYNALVLYAVLEDGRPASVKDVPGWIPVGGSGFFLERAFLVQGMPTSLWEIEHERLRGRVMDFRDHAALNCASRSCPPLRAGLYARTPKIDKLLKEQMETWVADEARGVRIEDGQAVFNPIFDWFDHDFRFLNNGDDLCTTVARFSTGERRAALESLAAEGCPHTFFEYDWSLNVAR
jgi:hypothetical protein